MMKKDIIAVDNRFWGRFFDQITAAIYINSVSDLLSLAKNCAYDQWSVGKTVILQKDLSLEGML